jgi:uncharacterized protein YkwD
MLVCVAAGPATEIAGARVAPEARMIGAINRVRAEHGGLRPLRPAPQLGRTAVRFSRWLIRKDLFSHSSVAARRKLSSRTGEALAMHYSRRPQIGTTIRCWLASPPHRALVLTRSMNVAGVGYANGRFGSRPASVWVLEVARG